MKRIVSICLNYLFNTYPYFTFSQGQWCNFAVILTVFWTIISHPAATESLEVSLVLWTREMGAIKWYTQSQVTCFGTAVLRGEDSDLWFWFLLFQQIILPFCKHNLSPTPARALCNYFLPFFQICYSCWENLLKKNFSYWHQL